MKIFIAISSAESPKAAYFDFMNDQQLLRYGRHILLDETCIEGAVKSKRKLDEPLWKSIFYLCASGYRFRVNENLSMIMRHLLRSLDAKY